jgi:hypothetical protein
LKYACQQISQPVSRQNHPSVSNPARVNNVARRQHGSRCDHCAIHIPTYAKKKRSGQPAMNRSKQAGMAIKTVVALLVGLALASVHHAEAQQQISGKQLDCPKLE